VLANPVVDNNNKWLFEGAKTLSSVFRLFFLLFLLFFFLFFDHYAAHLP
jgi:hypothetical protein